MRSLVRRCRQIDSTLHLPEPFDEELLLGRLSEQRGRPIEVMPVRARADLPCGLLISTDQADYILYRADTAPLFRRHILVHEIAHLLFDHTGSTQLAPASAQVLLPHLSPALVQQVLGRTVYTEPQEQEAELLASMILSRSMIPSRSPRGTAGARPRPPAPSLRLESLFAEPSPGADG